MVPTINHYLENRWGGRELDIKAKDRRMKWTGGCEEDLKITPYRKHTGRRLTWRDVA